MKRTIGAVAAQASSWGVPLLVLLIIVGLIEGMRPGSFALSQLALICASTLILLFVATGETLVILRGGIDLSLGGILSLASAIAATRPDLPAMQLLPWLLLILGLGIVVGIANALIISWLKLQPFLVTLATWSIVEGIALVVQPSEGGTVPPVWFAWGYSTPLGIPISVVLLGVLILWWVWFRRTRLANRIKAAGSHERSAYLNRVSLTGTNIAAYGIAGFFAAVAGFFYATQTGAGSPTVGGQYVLPAIAAVVIGGTSLAGGRGGLTGTIIGAFILNLIGTVVFLLKLTSYWQIVAQGVILVLVVILTSLVEATSERSGDDR
jgi:ribose transport system permease protein